MARGKKHPPEVRAAVIAALLAGQGVREVATQYKLDKAVVSRWKSTIAPHELQRVATKQADEFTELIANTLRNILKTVAISAERIGTKEGWAWLRQHDPSSVATLLGVLTDKGFRICEAAEIIDEEGNRESDQLETTTGAANPSIQ